MSHMQRVLTFFVAATCIAWSAVANVAPSFAQDEPRPPRDSQRSDDPPRDEGRPPRPRRGPEGDGPEGFVPGGPGRDGRDPEGRGPGPGGPGLGGPGPEGRGPDGRGLGGFPPPGAPPRPGDDFAMKRERDPEMFKLDKADMDLARHCMELSERYHDAPAADKAKLKAEIEQTVTKNFEVRQQRRALELKRIEQELSRLRQSIERREKDKQKLINQRTMELTEGDEDKRF